MRAHREGSWFKLVLLWFWIGGLSVPVFGQPRPVNIPQLDRSMSINSISKLRVVEQSEDGTELTLVMHYSYNGNAGSTALLVPIVERKDHPISGSWFGADMVTVPRGKGIVSMKVKFFNDEPGVPAMTETDRVRVLILNHSGSSIIGGKNLLKKVKWGREDGGTKAKDLNAYQGAREEIIQLANEAEDRARMEARLAANAEAEARKEFESSKSDQEKFEANELAEKNAKIKIEAEARATEAALIRKEQKELHVNSKARIESAPIEFKTRITNIEVVNRSRDRSRMTLGIEFELRDNFGFTPFIGAKIESSKIPESETFFESIPVEANKRKKFVLLPVTFSPLAKAHQEAILTDTIVIFATDETGDKIIPLQTSTKLLTWRVPGASAVKIKNTGSIVLQGFRQRNDHSGYATVVYHLPQGGGELRVRVFDSKNPESASWFDSDTVKIDSGRGLKLIPVRLSDDNGFPGGEVNVDTVEVELIGQSGQVVEKLTRLTAINWSRKI